MLLVNEHPNGTQALTDAHPEMPSSPPSTLASLLSCKSRQLASALPNSVLYPMDCLPPVLCPWDSPGGNAGVSCRGSSSGASSPQPGMEPGLSTTPGSFPTPLPPGKPLSALLLTEYLLLFRLICHFWLCFFTPFSQNLWLSPWVLSKILYWILS